MYKQQFIFNLQFNVQSITAQTQNKMSPFNVTNSPWHTVVTNIFSAILTLFGCPAHYRM